MLRYEDVRWLHVAVDDPLGVGVGERATQPDPDLHDVAVGQAARHEQLAECRTADELGDEVGAVVVDRGLVQRHDARMAEARGRAGLALEPPSDDPLARQELDRHVALEPLVARVPHGAEPAGPEAAMEAVAIEDQRALIDVAPAARAPAIL